MRVAPIVLSAALLLAAPVPLLAAEPEISEEARDQAREFGGQGIAAYKQGRYQECIEKMKQAEALFHAPAHLLYMARSYAALKRLVEAHRLFVDIAVEEIPSYAADAFHQAQKEARAKLYELRTQVTGVEISIAGVPRAAASVSVDGTAVPNAELDHLVALAPGEHVIEARAEGYEPSSKRVQIEAGARPMPIELGLVRKATPVSAPPAAPPPSPPSSELEPTEPPGRPLIVPGAIALALGGAALAAGGIVGGMTLSEASSIKESCNGTDCPQELESDADAAKTLGNASTGLLIAGGVVAAAGIVMLLIPPSDPGPGADQAIELRLRLGPAGASLQGWF